ncbi:hypothetical protein LE181_02005 [Streptomyces sp. SCA3-4]|uniref:hypothetical protein n=1 Tax=Streptomyces sichuanensis TaxID=2871810 RepID=UPI001CE25B5B|nr:hypothetical protein [Streptomyces sichuanensis]MCA6090948.1 hypothetical protein [Streptomyces sichuanensis]
MALFEKHPDNTAIDAQLRGFGIDPATIGSLPVIDPSTIRPTMWPVTGTPGRMGWGVIGRHKVMRYDFGTPTSLGPAVYNQTAGTITRVIGGTETIETSTTMSISTTVESSFFNTVSVSVTAGFSQTWSSSKTWKDELTVPIPPGRMMWLELKPVMRILDGDFVKFVSAMGTASAQRFSGTVTAPGLEGTLQDVIVVREAAITDRLAEGLSSAAENAQVRRNGDGTLSLPGFVAAALLGEDAKSTDVTDQVRPA